MNKYGSKAAMLVLCGTLAAITQTSNAEVYVGASVGSTDVDVTNFDKSQSLAIHLGLKFNENFSLEGTFLDLGESDDGIPPVWTIDTKGFNFSAVGVAPVGSNLELFAKAGVFFWDIAASEDGFGEFYSNDGKDLSLGLGALLKFNEQFGVRAEFQSFDVDEEKFTNIAIGVNYTFPAAY